MRQTRNEAKISKTTEQTFIREAERELAELMAEVAGTDVRHGPKRRTLDQERDLLEARLGALEHEHHEVAADLEAPPRPQKGRCQRQPQEGAEIKGASRQRH
jgi:hypothetical protein